VKVLSGNSPVESVLLDKRAEQLSVADFVALTNAIEAGLKK
jgi:16S rRNA A1518/A1519 N6-dimethyltransferase RsmA/KsgA/DIM1 with predicted DNA glycosylase/AP lyase activity